MQLNSLWQQVADGRKLTPLGVWALFLFLYFQQNALVEKLGHIEQKLELILYELIKINGG